MSRELDVLVGQWTGIRWLLRVSGTIQGRSLPLSQALAPPSPIIVVAQRQPVYWYDSTLISTMLCPRPHKPAVN